MLITLNDVEPAPIGFRAPVGLAFTLPLTFQNLQGAPVDPTPLYPQLVLMPHTRLQAFAYDVITAEPLNGKANVAIPGATLVDRSGYGVELYSRNGDGSPAALLGRGRAALTGEAYKIEGPLGPMIIPTVAGPPGPPGAPGMAGQRGSLWFTGNGPPTVENAFPGDMYLNEDNGDVWRYEDGVGWIL